MEKSENFRVSRYQQLFNLVINFNQRNCDVLYDSLVHDLNFGFKFYQWMPKDYDTKDYTLKTEKIDSMLIEMWSNGEDNIGFGRITQSIEDDVDQMSYGIINLDKMSI